MQTNKGFTIIELIVVIAIIAVLATIVLVNVTGYIAKGKNAAIQGNLATLLTNSAVYFDQNPSKYGSDFIADNSVGAGTTGPVYLAIKSANGGTADLTPQGSTSAQTWCASSTLQSGAGVYCVDSTGYKGIPATLACSTTVFTCK